MAHRSHCALICWWAVRHLTEVFEVVAEGRVAPLAVGPEGEEHHEAGHCQARVQEAHQPHDQQQHHELQQQDGGQAQVPAYPAHPQPPHEAAVPQPDLRLILLNLSKGQKESHCL